MITKDLCKQEFLMLIFMYGDKYLYLVDFRNIFPYQEKGPCINIPSSPMQDNYDQTIIT